MFDKTKPEKFNAACSLNYPFIYSQNSLNGMSFFLLHLWKKVNFVLSVFKKVC